MSERHRVAADRGESDPTAIRRPCRTKIAGLSSGERRGSERCQIHGPEIGHSAPARADEYQFFAIGRECRLIVVGRVCGEPRQSAAVGIYTKQICRSVPVGCENDGFPVRRPYWVVIRIFALKQRALVTTVGCGNEQLQLALLRKYAAISDSPRRGGLSPQ